jgi:hypothetical protein
MFLQIFSFYGKNSTIFMQKNEKKLKKNTIDQVFIFSLALGISLGERVRL